MKAKPIITVLLLLFVAVSIFAALSPKGSSSKPADGQTATSSAQEVTPNPGARLPERHFSAIYFMTDVRCPSCIKIETWSHEAITTAFEDELKSGLLKWEMLNYEQKENEHFVKKYGLITKSVVLVEYTKGVEIRFKNLPEIWNLLGDEEVFSAYVTEELRLFLNPKSDDDSDASETS